MFKSILILVLLSLSLGTAAWLFFVWAVKKGAFDDMERAKYRMLEDDETGARNQENNSGNEESK